MKEIVAAKPDAKINYIYQQTKFPVIIFIKSVVCIYICTDKYNFKYGYGSKTCIQGKSKQLTHRATRPDGAVN